MSITVGLHLLSDHMREVVGSLFTAAQCIEVSIYFYGN